MLAATVPRRDIKQGSGLVAGGRPGKAHREGGMGVACREERCEQRNRLSEGNVPGMWGTARGMLVEQSARRALGDEG